MKYGKRAALGLRVFLLCFLGGVARWGRSASPGSFVSRASGLSQDDGKLAAVEFAAGKDWLF